MELQFLDKRAGLCPCPALHVEGASLGSAFCGPSPILIMICLFLRPTFFYPSETEPAGRNLGDFWSGTICKCRKCWLAPILRTRRRRKTGSNLCGGRRELVAFGPSGMARSTVYVVQ